MCRVPCYVRDLVIDGLKDQPSWPGGRNVKETVFRFEKTQVKILRD